MPFAIPISRIPKANPYWCIIARAVEKKQKRGSFYVVFQDLRSFYIEASVSFDVYLDITISEIIVIETVDYQTYKPKVDKNLRRLYSNLMLIIEDTSNYKRFEGLFSKVYEKPIDDSLAGYVVLDNWIVNIDKYYDNIVNSVFLEGQMIAHLVNTLQLLAPKRPQHSVLYQKLLSFIKEKHNQYSYVELELCSEYTDLSIEKIVINDDIEKLRNQNLVFGEVIDTSGINNEFSTYVQTKLELAAVYKSINCFRFLLERELHLSKNIAECAVIGGDLEILKILNAYIDIIHIDIAIKFRQIPVFDWYLKSGMVRGYVNFNDIAPSRNIYAFYVLYECCVLYCEENYIKICCEFKLYQFLEYILVKEPLSIEMAWISVGYEDENLVKIFLRKGFNIDKVERDTSFFALCCVKFSNISFLESLLTYSPNLNANFEGENLLCVLLDHKFYDTAKFIIKNGAIVRSSTLFLTANLEMIEILVEHGANINILQEGYSRLWKSIKENSIQLANWLLDRNAEVGEIHDRKSLVTVALEVGNEDLALRLLELGAPFKEFDHSYSPLAIAIETGKSRAARYMLEHGANPNVESEIKRTLLQRPIEQNDTEMVKLLLDKGCENQNSITDSPVLAAVQANNKELLLDLIENGYDVNPRVVGDTPLILATKNENYELVDLLIEYGASINERDTSGRTPLLISYLNNNSKIYRLIKENGGALDIPDYSGVYPKDI